MILNTEFSKIDHIAIAVRCLKSSIQYYTETLGFRLDVTRETKGEYSGMRSAVLWSGDFSIVLLEAIGEKSQVAKFIDEFGPGVQHVAFKVENIEKVRETLLVRGIEFSTSIIKGPGLKQMFTHRDTNSGMMFEYIERIGENDFNEDSINELFKQLESQNAY
ncbi:hypothetical protein BB427_16375 [Pseudoalteromonas sp. BMB]|uniref:VOC family protein n=1 Tax=Pseudoalteromonas sp. BMB TaxID=1874619 RepID=UPI00083D9550|nr:VOC family protein [Pseudoalteromonas sp. BMB]ODB35882.1 hypothetical protein BB427_16375 [Pseudoalteromonas sp. BMB]